MFPTLILFRSIHPQGWVPFETRAGLEKYTIASSKVAFTPKGGCPLKLIHALAQNQLNSIGSIHPQGWVPFETCVRICSVNFRASVAFTPKGGCPLKLGRC